MPKGAPASDAGAQQDTEGLDTPDMASGEDCIPLSALAMPDPENGDQMATPETGDKVNYQIEGTVTRIEGENAYVKRETVNGQPVKQGGDSSGEDTDADAQEGNDLRSMAGNMGGMS